MIDEYTGREIVSPADKLTDEEMQTERNGVVDFLAQINVVRKSATDEQWAKFLAGLGDDERNMARRFFDEMREFPLRYLSAKNDSCPCR